MLRLWGIWLEVAMPVLDRLLGWTLSFPRDGSLCIVVLLTTAVLLALRVALVNRSLMQVIKQDQQRLMLHVQQARKLSDHEALGRHRLNQGRIAVSKLFVELPAVLIGVILFSTVLHWSASNLNYLPLQAGASFQLILELPAASDGMIAHLVPEEGLHAETGWVKQVARTPGTHVSRAQWKLIAKQGRYLLKVRLRKETLLHRVAVDGRTPPEVQFQHEPIGITRIEVENYRPVGVIGSFAKLPAWLVGFLFFISPLYLGAKRILRIP